MFNEIDKTAPRYSRDYLSLLEKPARKGAPFYHTEERKAPYRTYYKELYERYPELKGYKEAYIKKFITSYHQLIVDTLVDNKDGVRLPEYMGNMIIATYGRKHKSYDRKSSTEYKQHINYSNLHSERKGGWVFHVYSLEKYKFANHQYWRFYPGRYLTSKIGQAYKKGWKNYRVIPRTDLVSDTIKRLDRKDYIKEVTSARSVRVYNPDGTLHSQYKSVYELNKAQGRKKFWEKKFKEGLDVTFKGLRYVRAQ